MRWQAKPENSQMHDSAEATVTPKSDEELKELVSLARLVAYARENAKDLNAEWLKNWVAGLEASGAIEEPLHLWNLLAKNSTSANQAKTCGFIGCERRVPMCSTKWP